MLNAVKQTYGSLSMPTKSICVSADSDPETILEQAKQHIKLLNNNGGVLVLTDVFGGTPSNIAHKLHNAKDIFVISGLSLTMLLRIFNYPDVSLAELAKKAVAAGREGVTSLC